MFEWLDTAVTTLAGVTVTRLWPLAALASLLIAWVASRKRYSAFAWFAAGLNPTVPASFFERHEVAGPPGRVYWFDDYQYDVTFGRTRTKRRPSRASSTWAITASPGGGAKNCALRCCPT